MHEGKNAQQVYTQAVIRVVAEFRVVAEGDPKLVADDARAALALCIGGLLINNACGDDPEGKAVTLAARREVRRLLVFAEGGIHSGKVLTN